MCGRPPSISGRFHLRSWGISPLRSYSRSGIFTLRDPLPLLPWVASALDHFPVRTTLLLDYSWRFLLGMSSPRLKFVRLSSLYQPLHYFGHSAGTAVRAVFRLRDSSSLPLHPSWILFGCAIWIPSPTSSSKLGQLILFRRAPNSAPCFRVASFR